MNQYEAMFLFDPTFGSSFEDCETEVRRLMERAKGEILICRKRDERRLAYRIQ
ncbi:MAG: 30S ribosomal protein S6, partial [Planctomycetes bacterium]|nr:30S ribosomal protein S6 [Planctomycetota bacterium]